MKVKAIIGLVLACLMLLSVGCAAVVKGDDRPGSLISQERALAIVTEEGYQPFDQVGEALVPDKQTGVSFGEEDRYRPMRWDVSWYDEGALHYFRIDAASGEIVRMNVPSVSDSDAGVEADNVLEFVMLRLSEMKHIRIPDELGEIEPTIERVKEQHGLPVEEFWRVEWRRHIEGVPVVGRGWVMVHLSTSGEIVRYISQWQEIDIEVNRERLIGEERAIEYARHYREPPDATWSIHASLVIAKPYGPISEPVGHKLIYSIVYVCGCGHNHFIEQQIDAYTGELLGWTGCRSSCTEETSIPSRILTAGMAALAAATVTVVVFKRRAV